MEYDKLIELIIKEVKRELSKNNNLEEKLNNENKSFNRWCNLIDDEINFLESRINKLKEIRNSIIKHETLLDGIAFSSTDSDKICDVDNCTGCGYCVVQNKESVQSLIDAGAIRISSKTGLPSDPKEIAKFIDHTLLKPDATAEQIVELCNEAKKYGFASVCINPTWVSLAYKILRGTEVKICTVIGFPLGATTLSVKAYETRLAIQDGADEIDMVINIGALKSKNYALVREDIKRVVDAAQGKIVKVILETAMLTDEEKIMGCTLAKAAGAHYVKTSTGFGPGGATVKDVELMRKAVGEDMGVKASGGVRDSKTAIDMIKAGATRIGASASVAIVSGKKGTGTY